VALLQSTEKERITNVPNDENDVLEWRVKQLELTCKEVIHDQQTFEEEIKTELKDISKFIFQVRWMMTGAVVTLIAIEVGFIELMKAMMFA